MASSYEEHFLEIVRSAKRFGNAHLCDGDARTALVWSPETEISIRLALRGDEVWILAGSGMLVRFVATSDGDFTNVDIEMAIDSILRGEATEHFGATGADHGDLFSMGYHVGPDLGYGGLTEEKARFSARIAGPFAGSALEQS